MKEKEPKLHACRLCDECRGTLASFQRRIFGKWPAFCSERCWGLFKRREFSTRAIHEPQQ
jgi:hypothetical protein